MRVRTRIRPADKPERYRRVTGAADGRRLHQDERRGRQIRMARVDQQRRVAITASSPAGPVLGRMPDLLRDLIRGEIGDLANDPTNGFDILRYLVGQISLINRDQRSFGRIQQVADCP